MPAYFLLVAIAWVGLAIVGPNHFFNNGYGWTQFLLLTNWTLGLDGGSVTRALDVTWSVALEEQFYLIFPFVVLLTPAKRLPLVLAGIALRRL